MFPRYRRNQIIAFGIVILLSAGGLLMWQCVIPGLKTCREAPVVAEPPTAPITLEFWNVFEDAEVYEPFIAAFEEARPGVTIEYRKKEFATYERDLENAFRIGEGPAIFAMHNTWLPKQKENIAPAPSSRLTLTDLRERFPDVVQFDFADNMQGEARVFALPLSIDTLALFYNAAYFDNVGLEGPPETWDEFAQHARAITTKNALGKIDLAGAAFGAAGNVNRATDILGLLMLQTGARMTDSARTRATFAEPVIRGGEQFDPGRNALEFYTSFANPASEFYAWDSTMPGSVEAFTKGEAAMMLSYSYMIPTLKESNRYLDFMTAPAPRPEGQGEDIAYANYWGLSVSQDADESDLAWEFILFLLEEENAQAYLQEVERPASQTSLLLWQESLVAEDPESKLAPFIGQVPAARSWYQGDNVATERAIMEMIESVAEGDADAEEALRDAASQVTTFINELR